MFCFSIATAQVAYITATIVHKVIKSYVFFDLDRLELRPFNPAFHYTVNENVDLP